MIKKYLSLCFTLIIMLFFSANVWAASAIRPSQAPVKIVILPLINPSSQYPDVNTYIDKQLHKAVHIPLNGVLGKTILIDSKTINHAIETLNIDSKNLNTKVNMQALAQSLDSDLVISLKIRRMYQHINYSAVYINEAVMHSNVYLQLTVYDNKTKIYKTYNKSAFYDDSYSPQGTVQTLTRDILYDLLHKSQLKQYL